MDVVSHASERLAPVIVVARWHKCDPRTFSEWGRAAAVSPWQLRAWCQVAQVPGRDVLSFVRGLRAATQAETDGSGYEELLDIADPRALERFLQKAGFPGRRGSARVTVDQFLTTQRFLKKPELLERVTELVEQVSSRPT
jgi:hypothetical protein